MESLSLAAARAAIPDSMFPSEYWEMQWVIAHVEPDEQQPLLDLQWRIITDVYYDFVADDEGSL